MSLLYLHGWGLHGGIWAETAAELPGLTPDLPGYGDMPSPDPYRAETLADALAATLTQPADVIGWSMGGMVALALAARHPARVRRLVLVGTSPCFVNRAGWTHGLEPAVLAGFASDLAQDYRATLLRFLALQARGGEAARGVVARLRERVFARGEPAPGVLSDGLTLLREVDLRSAAAAVRCPTLVVHGAHDTLCPPAAGDWLAATIPGAQMAQHAGASHAPFISHPDWFVATLRGFCMAETRHD